MRFGPIPVADAEGATLAHSLQLGGRRLSKGTLLGREIIAQMIREKFTEVIAAQPDADDLTENDAADRLAKRLIALGIYAGEAGTGRVNLHAGRPGLLSIDIAALNALNAIDPAVTIATLPDGAMVRTGQMLATVKIIPFFVSQNTVDECIAALGGKRPALELVAFQPKRVGLIQTTVGGTADKMLSKTAEVTAARLARAGSHIAREMRVAHRDDALSDALVRMADNHDLLIVFGASAVCDFDDVIPAAIHRAEGSVERVGMPVDPGNLLVLGTIRGKPVIGAPGCARSPKENGFDWVLDRILVDNPPSSEEIAAMGVGGLLQEIETRPRPRENNPEPVPVSAIVLAAGASKRMGERNKLLASFDGETSVHRVAREALRSVVDGVIVVTGHDVEKIGDTLADLSVAFRHNPDFAEGMAGSLRAGLESVPSGHGAVILLGDMPHVTADHIDRIIQEFQKHGGRAVTRGSSRGKAGNPVILPAGIVSEAMHLTGDTGARHLIEASGAPTVLVEIGNAALIDIDTPEALAAAGGSFEQ
ncbi:NTP transferase domain-containing protein [Notoacmeibacter sp. MSK16QG-6]|uniref:NTP transferase domain-containing protein n=1 Tax=Notoacmeibacter sp. MSK16QG-6 TaxID=2957982 RepID=UPI00209EE2C0|nr:molybdopterin-binding/glycosyltransferase family 2 protein [Notoacmeibacter sp. MSK16QG-6]MCP1199435.1 molybdopterin-binding/glycosyltransferase family 2 protein [Notoacmeibacter sp. MSK16QG-6]